MKLEELEKYISDDIMDELFSGRCEALYDLSYMRKDEQYQKLVAKYPTSSSAVCELIESLPADVADKKKKILAVLDYYIDGLNNIGSYENELFYKAGFCDGIRIMLERAKSGGL